jgi:hypothetical protein
MTREVRHRGLYYYYIFFLFINVKFYVPPVIGDDIRFKYIKCKMGVIKIFEIIENPQMKSFI